MKACFFYIAALIAILLSGCSSDGSSGDTNQLPWSRPASWEGGPAGFGNLPGVNDGKAR